MIKRFLFIEYGSVDSDNLCEELDNDTKVIIYRQGSKPPVFFEPKEDARYSHESIFKKLEKG